MNLTDLLIGMIAAPGVTFLALGSVWLLGWTPSERIVSRVTAAVQSLMVLAALGIAYGMISAGRPRVDATLGDWFQVGSYHFPLSLVADQLSIPLMVLTTLLIAIVGSFSVRYLHRERGFFRFFLLLHLFSFGALVVFAAGTFELLLTGWELVGITSVLLIAFFDDRREPVRNAMRVYATYRIADLGLVLGIFWLHAAGGTSAMRQLFQGEWPNQTAHLNGVAATVAGLLVLFAAAGKSAQLPFSGWLPRAMEGPTPSSAIFYGAISVHMGAYLLLRTAPMLQAAPVKVSLIGAGLATAFLGTLTHRVVSDAKTSLAYATMAQLGLVFVEIGLGFPKLALLHVLGHAAVRTLQFLRAPSMLHDYHRVHAAAGGQLPKTGAHYEGLLAEPVRAWLYRMGLERGFYDAVVERLVSGPAMRFSKWLSGFEPGASQRPASESRDQQGERWERRVEG